ncbi:MAG: DUF349 domain-containing protein [Bacteroidales bacterium]|nr:DUF349 domain-containing protein [Bacteroidales bacterium]
MEKMDALNSENVNNESIQENETVATQPAISEEKTFSQESSVQFENLTKEQIITALKNICDNLTLETPRQEIENLKQAFYRIQKKEAETQEKAVTEEKDKENENTEVPAATLPKDENDELFKNILKQIKEKKAVLLEQVELVRENNYQLKLSIIEELKKLSESQEDFGKLYNEFKTLQQRWKEITDVPQGKINELWKNYQYYTEKLYDLIKINIEMRDYDFKKNLELKTALCEAVENLSSEKDVISAFHQLQKLHEEWREIGPVSKELREEIWQRFKEGSAVINKRHHEHFEALKASEQKNLEDKQAICQTIEEIDLTSLKSFKDWEENSNKIIELQQKWRTIGFTPKKENTAIFARFRAACDNFFSKKSEYIKQVRSELESNLTKKKNLCEQAEALKDSTDWKTTSEKLIALQKEWKTVGPVARKESDAIWKRFVSACDYFFELKNKNTSSQRSVEQENLKQKEALIEELRSFDTSASDAIDKLHEYINRFNQIGHVPFKDKDKIYKTFHALIDEYFGQLKVDKSERRMESFRNSINEMVSNAPKGKILGERERLMRTYERIRTELQTYENNIGFLSVSSKGGNSLLKEMERKVEKLKEDMALIIKKIDTIDDSLS